MTEGGGPSSDVQVAVTAPAAVTASVAGRIGWPLVSVRAAEGGRRWRA